MTDMRVVVVIPNWNEKEALARCLESLQSQSRKVTIVVVDNGSIDNSAGMVQQSFPDVKLIRNPKNLGFTGGVNPGLQWAIDKNYDYAALLNNDAVADERWAEYLTEFMESHPKAGIATSKICDLKKTHLDSTGEGYSVWGLSFPRGRGEPFSGKYDKDTWIFGASGGASIYRTEMLRQIGLFDDDFFAYYEDVDISFRAQLAGWKVAYVPKALVYHEIGATSAKIKGFTTYQTMKNLPQVVVKNAPGKLFWSVGLRFKLAYWSFFFSAISRGQGWPALKGLLMALVLVPKKLNQRHKIQKNRKVSVDYIESIITHDLPPNAHKLRRLRHYWFKLTGMGRR